MINNNPEGKGGFQTRMDQINREGRPKVDWEIVDLLKEELNKHPVNKDGTLSDKTRLESIIETLATLADKGNIKAAYLLMAYLYGKPRENIHHDVFHRHLTYKDAVKIARGEIVDEIQEGQISGSDTIPQLTESSK